MHKPATLIDALDVVRKSRLVSEDRLDAYLDDARADLAPDELFRGMVDHGLLTAFQASQLGRGRWKGFEIGNYRILDRLGQGGHGQVFLAEHLSLGKRVALKILSRHGVSPLALERFLREARAAAKLNHPNIIHVHDINPEHDPPFIVMEYADGITLQAAVARVGPLAPAEAAWIGFQVATGLDAAHRHGLVHRDIKPANILVDRRGIARILDLGIVRVEGENLTGEYAKNVILGTLDFFSPEQALDSSGVDIRTDLYSLGATLYFAVTGGSPLAAGTVRERLNQLQSVDPPDLRVLRPDMPATLVAALHRMLAKAPRDRFQTPQQAADALAPFANAKAPFPANLFRHERSTLSDTDGAPTPAGGMVSPLTRIMEEAPTAEQSVECLSVPTHGQDAVATEEFRRSLLHAAESETYRRPRIVSWSLAALVIAGMVRIALYVLD